MNPETSSGSAPAVTVELPTAMRLSENSKYDFGEIARQMEVGNMTPKEISDGRNLISAYLSRMRWLMGVLAAKRARMVDEYRPQYKSMAETERAWEATPAGQQEVQLHHQIKALEGMFSALETNWFLLQGERKSNY